MRKFNCPACGAEGALKSAASFYAVCEYCKMMLVLKGAAFEQLGKMSELMDDPSVLQLGTEGVYDRVPFSLIGRLRLEWSGGFWNEWCALNYDGTYGWLAEAQGSYMFTRAMPADGLPARERIRPEVKVLLKGREFQVMDLKEAVCTYSEGELPFPAPQGRKSLSVDLHSEEAGFATLDYGPEGTALYVGKTVEFEALKLKHLKQFEGW